MASNTAHWDDIHQRKQPDEVSWFQSTPELSLEWIVKAGCRPTDPILDVGGGVSSLVDSLLDRGFTDVTVLDLSEVALSHSQTRLGARAQQVHWITGDILTADLKGPYAVWHDRAVFHFLTKEEDQQAYVRRIRTHLAPRGHVILATFADDGPEKCSGLPVARYSETQLASTLGDAFQLLAAERRTHLTPSGAEQRFVHGLFRKR